MASQADVEGARAAVAPARLLEADHEIAKVGLSEPGRHGLAEHSASLVALAAFAGDDQHELGAARLGVAEKRAEHRIGTLLAHAVQVEARVHLDQTARQA